jgi:hypothetical protein
MKKESWPDSSNLNQCNVYNGKGEREKGRERKPRLFEHALTSLGRASPRVSNKVSQSKIFSY